MNNVTDKSKLDEYSNDCILTTINMIVRQEVLKGVRIKKCIIDILCSPAEALSIFGLEF